jgi:hypothetical protein
MEPGLPQRSILGLCQIAISGLYEKVINVKADVAAVLVSATILVSATKRREWW